jgi:hypothetical protein
VNVGGNEQSVEKCKWPSKERPVHLGDEASIIEETWKMEWNANTYKVSFGGRTFDVARKNNNGKIEITVYFVIFFLCRITVCRN